VLIGVRLSVGEVIHDVLHKLSGLARLRQLRLRAPDYRKGDVVKMTSGQREALDALSLMATATQPTQGQGAVDKMKELIPRSCSRSAPGRIGSRGDPRARRSSAAQGRLAKCYGGDISRKRKLLEKQKRARSA